MLARYQTTTTLKLENGHTHTHIRQTHIISSPCKTIITSLTPHLYPALRLGEMEGRHYRWGAPLGSTA